jgi:5'-AMP-activated protein kinase regulatory gamma subunit
MKKKSTTSASPPASSTATAAAVSTTTTSKKDRIVLASDFPTQSKIVEISSDATIADALATLTSNGILSAPVYDTKKQRYLGMFDISDVLALVYGVDLLRHLVPMSKLHDQIVDIHGLKIDLSQSSDAQGIDMPVATMMQANGQMAPWWPVSPKSTLLDVVKRLAAKVDAPWSPCRRVPVVDPATGRVVKIISQSEMVSQIYHNVIDHDQIEPLFIQTPRTHHHGLCPVACVQSTDLARKAFEIIINKRVSAVPVLGPEGNIISAITNKDIVYLAKMRSKEGDVVDNFTTIQFVDHAKKVASEMGITRPEPCIATIDTPIHIIIKILGEKKTHRVFLIDKPNQPPVGVVSVSDIVKLILDEELPWPTSVLVEKVGMKGS